MSKVIVTELDVDIIKPRSGNKVFITGLAGEGIDSVDPRAFGDVGTQAAIELAIDDIGSDIKTLYIPPGTWTISSNLSIPANISLKLELGSILDANNAALTILGYIEASPYQHFTWSGTGTIDLTNSLINICPIQWWGGKGDNVTDNASIIEKAAESTSYAQGLYFPKGVYKVASNIFIDNVISTSGFRMFGDGETATIIRFDIDANTDGFTFGSGLLSRYWLSISDMSFIGAANSNRMAVRVKQWHEIRFTNVNFQSGSSEWACSIEGCIYVEWQNVNQHENGFESAYGAKRAANVFRLIVEEDETLRDYQTNVAHLNINIDVSTGYGLLLSGLYYGQGSIEVTGTIEAVAYPLKVYQCYHVNIAHLYMEGNTNPAVFEKCAYSEVNLYKGYGTRVELKRCHTMTFSNFYLGTLYIDPACRGIVVGPGEFSGTGGLEDHAPDTQVVGAIFGGTAGQVTYGVAKGIDKQNMIPTLLERWSNVGPVGWATGSWTSEKCGLNETDTTRNKTPHCWLVTSNGGTAYPTYNLDADILGRLKGKYINFSAWVKMAALNGSGGPQTFTSFPMIRIGVTTPDWVADTPYIENDGAKSTLATLYHDYYNWRALNDGTSGSTEPRWGKSATGTVSSGSAIITNFSDTTDLYVGSVISVASGFASSTQTVTNINGTNVTVGNNATSSPGTVTISWAHATTGTTTIGSRIITSVGNVDNLMIGTNINVTGFAATTAYVVAIDGDSVTVSSKATSSGSGKCIQINLVQTGNYIDDNGITWELMGTPNTSSVGRTLTNSDIDKFVQLVATNFIFNNTVSAYVQFYQYQAVGPADSKVYWSEPSLMAGYQVPMAVIQGMDEHYDRVNIGNNKVTFGSAEPGAGTGWHNQGDIHFNTGSAHSGKVGWVCTTAGDGAAATWYTFGVIS